MRNGIKSAFSLLLIVLLLAASILSADCAELSSVNSGDIITYEIYVNSYPRKIQAVDVSIYYDSSLLELIPESLELPELSGYLANTDLAGEVRFNSISINGFDFSEGGMISKVQFRAVNTSVGNITIGYEIRSFLDEDKIDLKDTLAYERTFVNNNLDTIPDDEEFDFSTESDSETDGLYDTKSYWETDSLGDDPLSDSESDSEREGEEIVSLTDVKESDTEDISETLSEPDNPDDPNDEIAPNGISYRNFMIIVASAVGVIFLIGLIFIVAAKAAKKGNHYS